jgi:hypothetical protein
MKLKISITWLLGLIFLMMLISCSSSSYLEYKQWEENRKCVYTTTKIQDKNGNVSHVFSETCE